MRLFSLFFVTALAFGFSGCDSSDDEETSSTDTSQTDSGSVEPGEPNASVTYYKDVKPIIDMSCAGCHSPGGAGVFDMTSYAAIKPWASAIALATHSKDMPPWAAYETDECTPRFGWKSDQRLSEDELTTLQAWADTGALEGDASDNTTEPVSHSVSLEDWDFEGSAVAPVEVEPGGDDFVCIVVDPGLTEETWIRGIEFVPDNEELVHHVVLFTDPTRASLGLMGEDGTYSCFGSAGVPGTVAAAWAPGVPPMNFPDDMATRISAGTVFVMQMHYSPQGGAANLSDKTKLRFKYAQAAPRFEVATQLMGNFDFSAHPGLGLVTEEDDGELPFFLIPAGAQQHRETSRWTYTGTLPGSGDGGTSGLGELKLLGLSPHMHYAGVDMKVWVDRPVAEETACDSSMVLDLLLCGSGAGCVPDNSYFNCVKDGCPQEYDAVTLPCWGCVWNTLATIDEEDDTVSKLLECETSVTPAYNSEQPTRECLVSAPKYSFEWQRFYEYDTDYEELPIFTPGTVLTIECNYNNSMENGLVAGALTRLGLDSPGDVELGDETLDEMCLVGLLFAFERRD